MAPIRRRQQAVLFSARVLCVATASTLILAVGGSAQAAPMFMGLGDLAGGSFASIALDTSADGSVVVGRSHPASGPNEAFRWTEAGGMVGLGGVHRQLGQPGPRHLRRRLRRGGPEPPRLGSQ